MSGCRFTGSEHIFNGPVSPCRIALMCWRFLETSSVAWWSIVSGYDDTQPTPCIPWTLLPTFLLESPPGDPLSKRPIESRRPRTRSGGVLGFVLKKFIAGVERNESGYPVVFRESSPRKQQAGYKKCQITKPVSDQARADRRTKHCQILSRQRRCKLAATEDSNRCLNRADNPGIRPLTDRGFANDCATSTRR